MATKPAALLTKTLKAELAYPAGMDWSAARDLLMPIRGITHRLLNAGILEELFARRESVKPNRLWAINEEMVEIQTHTKRDAVRNLQLPGVITDALQRRCHQAAGKYFSAKGSERIPSYKYGAPIFVRNGQNAWRLGSDGDKVVLSIKLTGGRTGQTQFVLRATRGSHWSKLRALAKGGNGYRLGDLKLIYDEKSRDKRGRRGKWFAIMTYGEPAPKPLKGKGTIAVHRGMYNFLCYATTSGHWGVLMRGNKLLSQKRRLTARGREMKRGHYERGSGARGHGKKRAFAAYNAIGDKIARCCKTACQQAAAAAMRQAGNHGNAVVVREDYGGIDPSESRAERRFIDRFPLYQLGEAIDWAAKKSGREVTKVPAEYISSTCPRCGNQDIKQQFTEKDRGRRERIFRCRECDYERPTDFVAVVHMLRRSGANMSVWDKRFKRELALARSIKKQDDEALSK